MVSLYDEGAYISIVADFEAWPACSVKHEDDDVENDVGDVKNDVGDEESNVNEDDVDVNNTKKLRNVSF